MSLHQKQIDLLRREFFKASLSWENRYSFLIIGLENTLFGANKITDLLNINFHSNTVSKAYEELNDSKEMKKIHQQNVNNLKEKGFLFIE